MKVPAVTNFDFIVKLKNCSLEKEWDWLKIHRFSRFFALLCTMKLWKFDHSWFHSILIKHHDSMKVGKRASKWISQLFASLCWWWKPDESWKLLSKYFTSPINCYFVSHIESKKTLSSSRGCESSFSMLPSLSQRVESKCDTKHKLNFSTCT